MKKSKGRYFILLLLILSYNIVLIMADTNNPELNFNGEWYSKGFSSVSSWKSYVNTFVSTLFKFKVAEKNGTIQFGYTGTDDRTYFLDTPVKYNKDTGELSLLYTATLPNGEVKYLDYRATLNGQTDLRKVLDPLSYLNKTIGEIVSDVLSKGIKIGLVGNRSTITMVAGKGFTKTNPVIEVNYEKIIPENFTSLLSEADYEPVINETNNTQIQTNNIINITNIISNNTNTSQELVLNDSFVKAEFNIVNPKPSLQALSIFVNQTEEFSIENSEYDSINWYLNGKSVKNNTKSYSFKVLKKGTYNVSVKVELDSNIKENFWKVEVKSRETPKKSSSLGIWIIVILGFIIFLIGIIYYLKKSGKKNPQTTLPIKNN